MNNHVWKSEAPHIWFKLCLITPDNFGRSSYTSEDPDVVGWSIGDECVEVAIIAPEKQENRRLDWADEWRRYSIVGAIQEVQTGVKTPPSLEKRMQLDKILTYALEQFSTPYKSGYRSERESLHRSCVEASGGQEPVSAEKIKRMESMAEALEFAASKIRLGIVLAEEINSELES